MLWMNCNHLGKGCVRFFLAWLLLFFYNEFVIYYATLLKCSWPNLNPIGHISHESPLRTMIIADTHLLGPFKGHPWDKLRREWQMERSFQTALTLFDPEVIILLGDAFDEGQWVDEDGWEEYLRRFKSIFRRAESVPMVVVPGNHDIGFHYHLKDHPYLGPRFNDVYDVKQKQVSSVTFKDVNFVLLNSMAFEGDSCSLCSSAKVEMRALAGDLRCARNKTSKKCSLSASTSSLSPSLPIVLQHFPLYRTSDSHCSEPDEAPPSEKQTPFREKWDCVSKTSTTEILKRLDPRLVISGHTHHGCLTRHSSPIPDADGKRTKVVPEYSVSSFSWRNRNNPAFLLAIFTAEKHAISKCLLPEESAVIDNYIYGSLALVFYFLLPWRRLLALACGLCRSNGNRSLHVSSDVTTEPLLLDKSL